MTTFSTAIQTAMTSEVEAMIAERAVKSSLRLLSQTLGGEDFKTALEAVKIAAIEAGESMNSLSELMSADIRNQLVAKIIAKTIDSL